MPRVDHSVERRTEIIAAAIRVLARDGITETTTRKIAAEAGVNQATLRYYFGSKDDLLFAVLQEMMRLTHEVVQSGTPSGGTIREIITRSIQAFWEHVESASELQVMQYELTLYALRHPASAWLAKQQYDGYASVVETLFQQHFEAANISCSLSFAELARFVVAGIDGLILQFISDRDTVRAQRDRDVLIAAVIALAESNTGK